MKRTIFAAAGLACLTLGVPAMSQYGGRGGASATFFVKDGYDGRGVSIDRPVRSFREFDMNDKVSSIRVQSGRWLVCEDDDFRGRCVTIDRSIGHLDRIGMDDRISSARPLDGGANWGGGNGGGGNWGGGNGGGGNGGDWSGGGNGGGANRPSAPMPGGSWAQSCRSAQMGGNVLRAECNDGRRYQPSQIDPRQCPSGRVGNNHGNLVCE